MEKVYCRYCGNKIDSDSEFCTHCGKSQELPKQNRIDPKSSAHAFYTKVCNASHNVKTSLSRLFSFRPSKEKLQKIIRTFKKTLKVTLIISIIGAIAGASYWGYDYYTNTYIPKKLLDEACADITNKFNSKNDSVKRECAFSILKRSYSWGYDNVSDYGISESLADYRELAFKYIETEAYAGDANCQYKLGLLYYYGEDEYFTTEDDVKAAYWWNEAAQQNYTKAYNNIGLAFINGLGVNIDQRKGIEYLKKGADAGDDRAQRNYGNLFKDGVKVKSGSHKETRTSVGYRSNWEGEKIREYYDSEKMEFITVYRVDVDDYEWLVPQDLEQAKNWWKKAASQGNEGAKKALQQIYK